MVNLRKVIVLFLIAGIFAIGKPVLSSAGGLQDKLKEKLGSGSKNNIQYNLDASFVSSGADIKDVQYEPYYYNASASTQTLSEMPIVNQRAEGVRDEDMYRQRASVGDSARRLVPQKESESIPLVSSYAIYRADYNAEIDENVATIKGNILFEVFKKGWTQIPLVSSSVGLIDVSVNKGASFVTMAGGRYYLMVDKPGRYNLEIEFLIKASRERENGPGSFGFQVIPAPISQFEFTMPETGVDIFVEPAIRVEVKKESNKTIAWAVMPNTNSITVRWTKALPKETIVSVKLEPKVYVDTATYASLGEGLIRCVSTVNYSILQAEVPNFRIALPEDVSVLEVRGNDLRDWKVSKEKDMQYLDVYLNFGVKGSYSLSFTYERKIGEGSGVAQIPEIQILGVERENGFLGLAASTSVELAVNKSEQVTPIDVKELPSTIWGNTTNPILLAFKYLNHPYSVAIDVTKHEEVPVLVAAVDLASYLTLQTDEGKTLTKATYQIRNNVKQFIHLTLPKAATLWSVFVAGKPVKPAKDKDGQILIPLEKSQLQGETLTQFPVEIVYLDKTPKMGFLGRLNLYLPKTDIPISALNWSLYLPFGYNYFNFSGDVKRVAGGFGYGGFAKGLAMQKSVMRGGKYGREMKAQFDDVGTQFAASVDVPQGVLSPAQQSLSTGVLPIKIEIPQEGRLYSFSKLLVTENERLKLSVNFIRIAKQVRRLLWFLAIGSVVVWIVRSRNKRIKSN